MVRRIGYAKIGRSISFNRSKHGFQGDAEAPQLLERLVHRNPDVRWVLVGKNDGSIDIPNVENPWEGYNNTDTRRNAEVARIIGELDGMVVHLGQHGTSQNMIPQSPNTWAEAYADPDDALTLPLDWAYWYGGFLVRGLNAMGDRTDGRAPVVWVCADPRNYLKARDVKWPTGTDAILSQYRVTRWQRQERFRDPRTPEELGFGGRARPERHGELWWVQHDYVYGGLELMILPDDWHTWGDRDFHDRAPAGVATTSYAVGSDPRRSEVVRDVLLSAFPDAEVWGKWDKVSLTDVPDGTVKVNDPKEFPDLLGAWRVTLSLPALGSSWTAAKPFQCFAARVVSFMWGRLDDQGWILPSRRNTLEAHEVAPKLYSVRDDWTETDLHLARWLRVETREEFAKRATAVVNDPDTWRWLVDAQRDLLQRRWQEQRLERMVEYGLNLGVTT